MKYDYDKLLNDIKNNSIGKDKKQKFDVYRKIVLPTASVLSAMILLVSLSSCSKTLNLNQREDLNNINETVAEEQIDIPKKDYTYDIDVLSPVLLYKGNDLRIKFSLYGVDMNDIKNNSIDDYKKLEGVTDIEIFLFYIYSAYDKVETEKLIISLGYNNWNDYLYKNGYSNFSIWLNECYQSIYDGLYISENVGLKM